MKKKLLWIIAIFILLCNTLSADLSTEHTQTLDAFIVKLGTYQNDSNYVEILDTLVIQLNTLKPKYSSSWNVPAMIDYLISKIWELRNAKCYNYILATFTEDGWYLEEDNYARCFPKTN
jgi:hypothetical protein